MLTLSGNTQQLLLCHLPHPQDLLARLEHTVACRLFRLASTLGHGTGQRNSDIIKQLIELRSSWRSVVEARLQLQDSGTSTAETGDE